jgi:hypothetical protein
MGDCRLQEFAVSRYRRRGFAAAVALYMLAAIAALAAASS